MFFLLFVAQPIFLAHWFYVSATLEFVYCMFDKAAKNVIQF